MSTVISQPRGTVEPAEYQLSSLGHDRYKVQLCDCCFSAKTFFCFPCAECSISGKLGENCCYPFCCGGMIPLNVRFRTLTGIQQSMCCEACEALCCLPCFDCRLYNEMGLRGY